MTFPMAAAATGRGKSRNDRRLRELPALVSTAALPNAPGRDRRAGSGFGEQAVLLGEIERVLQDAVQRRSLEAHRAGG